MLLAPTVVEKLLANPDVAINLESVLRRVMPLDWQEQGAVFARAGRQQHRIAQLGSYGWRSHDEVTPEQAYLNLLPQRARAA